MFSIWPFFYSVSWQKCKLETWTPFIATWAFDPCVEREQLHPLRSNKQWKDLRSTCHSYSTPGREQGPHRFQSVRGFGERISVDQGDKTSTIGKLEYFHNANKSKFLKSKAIWNLRIMEINGECLLLVWYMNLTAGLKVDWNYACPLCHAMNLMSRKFGLTKVIWISSPFYDYSTKTITGNSMLFMACFYKYWQVCGAGRIVNEHSSPFLSGKTQKRWLTRYTSFNPT